MIQGCGALGNWPGLGYCLLMIRPDKLTIKAQEALQSAQEIAQKLNH